MPFREPPKNLRYLRSGASGQHRTKEVLSLERGVGEGVLDVVDDLDPGHRRSLRIVRGAHRPPRSRFVPSEGGRGQ
jgi:hypothetical protein